MQHTHFLFRLSKKNSKMKHFIWVLFSLCLHKANAQDLPVNFSFVDSTIKPGNDFYRFANGQWLKTVPIPANQGMWAPIVALYEGNTKFVENRIRQLATQQHPPGSAYQLLGDFYASGLDTSSIESTGYRPLIPYLEAVDKIRSRQDILDFIARHIATPTNPIINLFAEPDARNNQLQIATLGQSGLAFSATYYLGKDAKSQTVRNQYRQYLTQSLILIGYSQTQAATAAERIAELEQQLAKGHNTPEQAGQPALNYNLTDTGRLNQQLPSFGWQRFFTITGLQPTRINVAQPRYYRRLDSLLNAVPISIWRDKLKTDYITAHALKLSQPFREVQFAFFGKTLASQKQPEAREKAVMGRIAYPLRDLVGQIYIKERFSESAKQEVLTVFKRIQTVYARRLRAASWLSPAARNEALRKLQTMAKKIGYPDRWDSYEGVTIRRNDFFGNTVRLYERNRRKNLQSFDRPVDKTSWRFMTAGTGASYSNSENTITLTAGYLQPPYFWAGADEAIKYSTIGRTIGHELTHAFDSGGFKYNAEGNLSSWFSPSDSATFVGRYMPLMKQFSQYTVLDSLKNNAKLTIGENIADLVGLSVAYEAFTETPQFKNGVQVDGLKPAQRFFLAYAQEQRAVYTPQMVRTMLDDAHPLEEFRVNGTLSNFSPFYEAFYIKRGDKLFIEPQDRVVIW